MHHATNRFTRSRKLSALAVVVLALGTAACGSDEDNAADTTSPSTAVVTTEVPSTDAATTEVPSTDAATTEVPSTDAATTDSPTTDAATTDESTADTSAAPATGDATVTVAESDLGTILVDGDGRTLYMFAPDEQGPSTCEDNCLASWPALTGPATAGEGVDDGLLATAPRPDDGTEQVTYDGWPLYYFANDAAPGDIDGQGVGDVWYVIDPSGAPIGMSAG